MAQIPISADVADLIGPAAEKVENRSLLLDKFVFHKLWPVQTDERGNPVKWDEASRWSFQRIADGASQFLTRDASEKRRRADGNEVLPENRERYLAEAKLAEALAKVSWNNKELTSLRARHTMRFVNLLRRAAGDRTSITLGRLESRLAINLADSLIQNAGISLDRLFGLPFIPGSAVKGVCRHAALEELSASSGERKRAVFQLFQDVFGTSDSDFKNGLAPYASLLDGRPANQKGSVAFLPAYPVNDARIVVDLTNVHYPDYYKSGRTEDLSKEKPRPNPFPVVEAGAEFAFCLLLTRDSKNLELLKAAERWLAAALTAKGLGAKTASGYGWFSLQPQVLEQLLDAERREAEFAAARARAAVEAEQRKADERQRLAAMSPAERAAKHFAAMSQEQFATSASNLGSLSADDQKGFLVALTSSRKDAWKNWKKSDKPANKARVQNVLAAAKNLGVTLP